jgi:hypothetical protein
METVRIYRLTNLRPRCRSQLYAAQKEAAQVWILCRDMLPVFSPAAHPLATGA